MHYCRLNYPTVYRVVKTSPTSTNCNNKMLLLHINTYFYFWFYIGVTYFYFRNIINGRLSVVTNM